MDTKERIKELANAFKEMRNHLLSDYSNIKGIYQEWIGLYFHFKKLSSKLYFETVKHGGSFDADDSNIFEDRKEYDNFIAEYFVPTPYKPNLHIYFNIKNTFSEWEHVFAEKVQSYDGYIEEWYPIQNGRIENYVLVKWLSQGRVALPPTKAHELANKIIENREYDEELEIQDFQMFARMRKG